MLVVRDVPALPNEFYAAAVTWLPLMSTDVAADVPCSAPVHACCEAGRILTSRTTPVLTGRLLALPAW